jgi:hypothetical protein
MEEGGCHGTRPHFATKGLGTVTVLRSNLRQLMLLIPQQASHDYEYVGNGTRLLFGSMARNLRKGEGYVQDADVFLIGINYVGGNNLSIGMLFTFMPSPGSNNLFSLTPRLAFRWARNYT